MPISNFVTIQVIRAIALSTFHASVARGVALITSEAVKVMSSPKRFQRSAVNQSKDFVWTVQTESEDNSSNSQLSDGEKAKIASKTFSDELKFDVPVDLEGSKHAFSALMEGSVKGNLSKSFAEMKKMDPDNLVDHMKLGDSHVTSVTS